jgi:hypothetical protein
MHVKDLRAALQEIEEVFSTAGVKAVQKDLASILELLGDNDNMDLSEFLEELRRNLPGPAPVPSAEWLRRLNEAGLEEAAFLKTLTELSTSACSKVELRAIAEKYTGSEFKAKDSKPVLLEAIKSEFYGRLYERDADKIAKRATPW